MLCCLLETPSYSAVSLLDTASGRELNYRAKKSLSGIKIQRIDGATDTQQLPIVLAPVHMSTSVVKPACCFQVSSPVSPQLHSH